MGILRNHKIKEYRFEKGDLKLKNPNQEQLIEIKGIIESNSSMDINSEEINAEFGLGIIRYLMRELSSIGCEIDEINDDELSDILDNADNDLTLLLNEIIKLIEEITEQILEEQLKQFKTINSMIKIIEMNLSAEETTDKFNKLLKRQKINLTVEEMVKYKDNPEKITELINQSKVSNNKTRKK